MTSLSENGEVNSAMAEFFIAIIEHTQKVYESSPARQDSDYIGRQDGETDSQMFPNVSTFERESPVREGVQS